MAQASRSKSKTKARPRSGNGAHESTSPARDYSIAAVGRALDLLEALSRIGPAPLAALADALHPNRRLPLAPHPRGAWLRDPG